MDEGYQQPETNAESTSEATYQAATPVQNQSTVTPRDYSSPFKELMTDDGDIDSVDKVSEVRKGYYPLIARIILLSCILDALLLIVFLLVANFAPDYLISATIIILILKVFFLVYYTIYITIKWTKVYFQFDGHTLVKFVGVYNPQQTVYNLNNLYSVDAHISILGRLLKYGHITLVFLHQDGEKQKVEIQHVIEPMKCKKYFARFLK